MAAKNGFWIDAPEVVRLFPTFVWKCDTAGGLPSDQCSDPQPIHEMWRALPPLDRGEAWQPGHGLHRLKEYSALVQG